METAGTGAVASTDLESYLRRFRLDAYRPGQREVIEAVLGGSHCLCIMPTGGGKSLCYQIPAVAREGLTLVVSPLIALMKDQVDSLQRLGIPATYVNSSLDMAEQQRRLGEMAASRYRLVYVAPERFRSPQFLESLRGTRVQLLAIDEAHCICEWGHDFRHDYSRLGTFRRRIGNPQTIALTATATEEVRQDIVRQLELESVRTFVAGFARPNLTYEVLHIRNKREKMPRLADLVQSLEGVGIVYTATRRDCGELAEMLRVNLQQPVLAYHGGMMAEDRRRIQEEFMEEKGRIVVATNAFGMGIDKPNVRFVIHYSIPRSLEAYYQEAGRAGRDGLPSVCILMYCPADRKVQEYFINSSHPPVETIETVYEFLRTQQHDPIELTQEELRDVLELPISAEGVGTCERLLEKCGVLERLEPQRNMAAVRLETDVPTLVDLLPRQATVQRRVARALEEIVGSRRFERVYFHPQRLAERCGMEISVVSRALRELSRLDAIDYVPPFRGRAVHMLHRDRPFDELQLDYDQLQMRRASAIHKLDLLEKFARSRGCRQLFVLEYFGEMHPHRCGVCDNCQRRSPAPQEGDSEPAVPLATDTPDASRHDAVTELVLKVLSGIARCQGRFGRQIVVGMLCGSRSSRIARWRLDQLSTFGILGHLIQQDVADLVDLLVIAGLVEQVEVERFRPVLQLTIRGVDVMRRKLPVPDAVRYAKLVEELAAADAASRPAVAASGNGSTDEARRQDADPSRQAARTVRTEPAAPSSTDADRPWPNYYWSWRLLHDGYTPQECLAIRGLDQQTLLDHLILAAEQGLPVDLDWVLDRQQQLELAEIPLLPDGRPQRLPPNCHAQHARLLRLCRMSANS